ncbi:MAG: hypothetical protein HDT44_03610 [Ruminococcaceae bacterium]|nr:hypothetical protein [Oscillospiraceae bacterium]
MENYDEVIGALTELQNWLKGHSGYYDQIENITSQLKDPNLTDFQRQKIKSELSMRNLFHVKCLGDVYVKDFPKDGTGAPWFNYLDKVCKLCQEKLS